MPPTNNVAVTPSDNKAGAFSIPSSSAANTLLPLKMSTSESAVSRCKNRCIIADSAKYKARRTRMAKMFVV